MLYRIVGIILANLPFLIEITQISVGYADTTLNRKVGYLTRKSAIINVGKKFLKIVFWLKIIVIFYKI